MKGARTTFFPIDLMSAFIEIPEKLHPFHWVLLLQDQPILGFLTVTLVLLDRNNFKPFTESRGCFLQSNMLFTAYKLSILVKKKNIWLFSRASCWLDTIKICWVPGKGLLSTLHSELDPEFLFFQSLYKVLSSSKLSPIHTVLISLFFKKKFYALVNHNLIPDSENF